MGIFDKLFKKKKTNQQLPIEELAIYALKLIDSGMACSTRELQLKLTIGFNKAESLKSYLLETYPDKLGIKCQYVQKMGNIPKVKKTQEANDINVMCRNETFESMQSPFLTGWEVSLSNNHDCKCRICDIGAGNYPPDYKFTVWHFGCRCFAIPIYPAGEASFDNVIDYYLGGQEDKELLPQKVIKDIPPQIRKFALENLEFAKTQDWFLDNAHYFIEINDNEIDRLRCERDSMRSVAETIKQEAENAVSQGEISTAISLYEQIIIHPYPDYTVHDKLIALYKEHKDFDNVKRVLHSKYDRLFLTEKYLVAELQKIADKENNIKPIYILPKEPLTIPKLKTNTLGTEFEKILRTIPEFDFYKDKPDNLSTLEFQLLENKKLHMIPEVKRGLEINRTFMDRITQGEEYEKLLDLARAAEIYEQMVSDKCQKTAPYDRLIKIYAKAKLPIHERRVLELAIKFFTELKQRQADYITELARKANKLDFCLDRIEQKQKIFYYSGIFELYNPYTIIDKWIERLEKLNKKIQ